MISIQMFAFPTVLRSPVMTAQLCSGARLQEGTWRPLNCGQQLLHCPHSPVTRSHLLTMRSSSCAWGHVYFLVPGFLLQLPVWDTLPWIRSSLTRPSQDGSQTPSLWMSLQYVMPSASPWPIACCQTLLVFSGPAFDINFLHDL